MTEAKLMAYAVGVVLAVLAVRRTDAPVVATLFAGAMTWLVVAA